VQRPAEIAEHALAAFSAAATAPADLAALAGAQALVVFFAGAGRESHTQGGDPNDPWSNYTSMAPPAGGRAAPLDEACVIAEEEVPPFGSFGVLCHEFGHLLGLPELYAPGGAAHEGVGIWDLMGQGTWLRTGERPPHLSAWSKLRLGWVDVETIVETTARVRLPAVTSEPRVVKIPAAAGVPEEYYLLENRERSGADVGLPGEGILVWHVDERVQAFRTAQNDPAHKLVHLVEADGRGDLDMGHAAGGNRGDTSDPWRGPPRWRARLGAVATLLAALAVAAAVLRAMRPRPWRTVAGLVLAAALLLAGAAPLRRGPVCGPGTPGMAPYDGGPTGVVLRNFSPAGTTMHVDVLVRPGGRD
jgi:M6 family metalloprotease-like protein